MSRRHPNAKGRCDDPRPAPATRDDIGSWRIEFGAGALSIAFAIVSAACAAAVIAEIYQPDVSRAMELASQLSFLNLARFRPEPQEKALFLSGLVVFFALLIPLHRWFRRVLSAQPPKAQATVLPRIIIASVLGIGVLGCIDMGEGNPFHLAPENSHDHVARTNFDFYFYNSFLCEHLLAYAMVFLAVAVLLYWTWDRLHVRTPGLCRKAGVVLVYAVCGAGIAVIFLINSFRFPYTYENKYDFGAVYYSIVQVYHGAPLLVDGFTNTYGLYPHFLAPLLKLTGAGIGAASSLLAGLTAICFLLLLLLLKDLIKRPG